MSRFHSHINLAIRILDEYDRKTVFSVFLARFFREFRKAGSRDRREISTLCYSLLRMGNAFATGTARERMALSLWLCGTDQPGWLEIVPPPVALPPPGGISLPERIRLLQELLPEFRLTDIFPCTDNLSGNIAQTDFIISHLQQPGLFVRIRPGRHEYVMSQLKTAGMAFHPIGEDGLELAPGTRLDEVLVADRDIVVQDSSSQAVGQFMKGLPLAPGDQVWDCCAASGGKSLLATDLLPGIIITVSDKRRGILENLQHRFQLAGISHYERRVHDLEAGPVEEYQGKYSLIIADVPCSGSGTWGRNPEWLSRFSCGDIAAFSDRQRKIATHAREALKPGGYFLYITCSVFQQENEEVLSFMTGQLNLRHIKSQYFAGYGHRADTLFAALLSA